MQISNVEMKNVRGSTASYELKSKNLVVGPNGSGKSSIALGINLALLGYEPGFDKKGVFANSSDDKSMSAGVTINGKSITREWKQGKTLSEKISVDGVEANRNSADAMIQLAIGKDPVVIDVAEFFASSSAIQRRRILKLATDEKTLDAVLKEESDAKQIVNEKQKERRSAEDIVEKLSKSLNETEKPAGNIIQVRKELEEAEKPRSEIKDRISKGEANDKARQNLSEQTRNLPEWERKEDEAKTQIGMLKKGLKHIQIEVEALAVPKTPEITELPENAKKVISAHIQWLDDLIDYVPSGPDKSTLGYQIDSLKALLSGSEELQAFAKAHKEYRAKLGELTDEAERSNSLMREWEQKLSRAQAFTQNLNKTNQKIDDIGPGVDEKDTAALSGLETQINDLRSRIKPLERVSVMLAEIEKAKLTAEKAVMEEEKAKTTWKQAVEKQKAIVEGAEKLLADASLAILPEGFLVVEDDGKDITIAWDRNGKPRVHRHTLSGGERSVFDAAVGYALCRTAMVIIEAAEVDNSNMLKFMDHLCGSPIQVMVLTCHPVEGRNESIMMWNVINK
jgi:DNA repair exonuclease SbcCD ATPase subunit